MTVSSTTNRNSFTCTGVKEFPFDFKIFAKTDLVVILRDPEGSETTLTLTTDYTVSAGPWGTGGTVTTIKSYTEGTLVIIRELPQTQGADYVENDPFPAETHEQGLDRAVMLLQEITERLARMLILAKSSSYSDLSLPDPVANKYLAWRNDLIGLKNIGIQSEGNLEVSEFIETLLDDADAAAVLITLEIKDFVDHGIDIPSGEIILFEKDTAVAGYTLKIDKDDMNVYVTKGSAAGGESGGSDKTGGTWTQPSHTLTEAEIPSHGHGNAVLDRYSFLNDVGGGTYYGANAPSAIASTGGDGPHNHGTAWRSPGRNFTRQERN